MSTQKKVRIVLMRHGNPGVALSGNLRAAELPLLAAAYQASGIVDTPPDLTRTALSGVAWVYSSDLPRARQSALALGYSDRLVEDALFAEARIPHFSRGRLRLPVSLWLGILRLLWLAGFSRNGESYRAAKVRAAVAATRLADMAKANGTVLLVGHGVMNYLIARRLRAVGWRGKACLRRDYWRYDIFESPTISG